MGEKREDGAWSYMIQVCISLNSHPYVNMGDEINLNPIQPADSHEWVLVRTLAISEVVRQIIHGLTHRTTCCHPRSQMDFMTYIGELEGSDEVHKG